MIDAIDNPDAGTRLAMERLQRRYWALDREHPQSKSRDAAMAEIKAEHEALASTLAPEPTEEEQIDAEVAKRLEDEKRKAAIRERLNDAMIAANPDLTPPTEPTPEELIEQQAQALADQIMIQQRAQQILEERTQG